MKQSYSFRAYIAHYNRLNNCITPTQRLIAEKYWRLKGQVKIANEPAQVSRVRFKVCNELLAIREMMGEAHDRPFCEMFLPLFQDLKEFVDARMAILGPGGIEQANSDPAITPAPNAQKADKGERAVVDNPFTLFDCFGQDKILYDIGIALAVRMRLINSLCVWIAGKGNERDGSKARLGVWIEVLKDAYNDVQFPANRELEVEILKKAFKGLDIKPGSTGRQIKNRIKSKEDAQDKLRELEEKSPNRNYLLSCRKVRIPPKISSR